MHKKLVFYFILENVPFLLKIDAIFKPCLKKFIFLNEQIKLIQNTTKFSKFDSLVIKKRMELNIDIQLNNQ